MRIQAGSARGMRLKGAPSASVRPSSNAMRETLFNVLQADVPDCAFLDLFAGTGSVGIEALSRGAGSCAFIEKNATCVRAIERNLALTGLAGRARVVRQDVARFLDMLAREPTGRFDIIFADPPYVYPHIWDVAARLLEADVGAHDDTVVVIQHHRSVDLSARWPPSQAKEFGDSRMTFYWDLPKLRRGGNAGS